MALFQRQPVNLSQNLPYTIAFSRATILIVGLGNPGKKYDSTRHNIGYATIDNFAKANDFEKFTDNKKFKGLISERVLGSNRVILFKPTTYMNLSGSAVRLVCDYYKIELASLVAVYDELSLDFGTIRTRIGGQSAGHKGVESLINALGADFGRLRVGINNEFAKNIDSSDFVLAKFPKEEQGNLPTILNEASNLLTEYIYSGKLPEQTRQVDV
jgi:PTH1 family peptidyl-tRNA hydrolase